MPSNSCRHSPVSYTHLDVYKRQGSGKSTLLRALLGILPPAEGVVRRAPGLRLGYVPQKLAIDRTMPMTVRRFLSLPNRVSDAEARAALSRVNLPDLEARQMACLLYTSRCV